MIPGKPARYFKVETPLQAVADMLDCTGYVDHVISKTEARHDANRIGYPSAYFRGPNQRGPYKNGSRNTKMIGSSVAPMPLSNNV